MEFIKVISARRSIRAFSRQPVEDFKIQNILQVVNTAPSAGNLQAYRVFVVYNKEKRKALSRAAYDQGFIAEAPVCLVFFSDPSRSVPRYGERGKMLYSIQDATIAATFAMLAAVNLGLSTVWVGAFDDDAISSILNVKGPRPIAILPISYGAEVPAPTPRRPLSETMYEIR